MKSFFISLVFLCVFIPNSQAARYYVNAAAGNDASAGTSWATAFKTFQRAIDAAGNNDEIWLTGGTYVPTQDLFGQKYPLVGKYSLAFFISKSLQIYGHFAGTETSPAQRLPATAATIFSGDVDGDDLANPAQNESDIQGDNTSRILYMTNLPSNGIIRLDDVVVTAAHNDGGFLLVDGGPNVTITHCRFTGNFSTSNESNQIGGVSFIGGSTVGCSPKVDHCTFDYNSNPRMPGGCFVWAASGPCNATFSDCNFQHNTGSFGGGLGMFAANNLPCTVVATSCNFTDNTALANGSGGGISCINATLTCSSCYIANNYAYLGGGIAGVQLYGDYKLQLTFCTIIQNNATRGGGVYLQQANASMIETIISFNNAQEAEGGGIFIDPYFIQQASMLSCNKVQLLYNSCATNGGGICNNDPMASVQIERSQFYANKATNGGAFCKNFEDNSTASLTINESLLLSNEANFGNGGAIYLKQAAGTTHPGGLKVTLSTLYDNLCNGNGYQVYADNAWFEGGGIISWIVSGASGTGEFYRLNGGSINVSQSLIHAADCDQAGINSCSGNIFEQDPLFVDVVNKDFRLQKCSPAVNAAGYSGGTSPDYEGNPRPYNDGNGLLDMGAYEYQGTQAGCLKVKCKNVAVNLGASGTISVPANSVNDGSTGCAALTMKINGQTAQTFDCSQIGAQLVTFKVTDCLNYSATCSATVTVQDITPPTLLCKPATLNLDANGQATLTLAQVNNGSSDNCSILNLSLTQTVFTCSNIGNNAVSLAGIDPSGNKGICNTTVTVKDVTAPTARCKNSTVNLNSNGTITVPATTVDNGSTDNCSLNFGLSPYLFTCANVGLNTVVLRATDGSGNSTTCTAVLTVKDVTAPNALCKNATITLNDVGQGVLTVNQLDNGSSDACGIASMILSKTQFNCSEIPGGPQNVTMTLKDINNNQSSCTAQVTVRDNIAPTAVCHNTTVQLGQNGTVTVYPANLAADSYDNCSVWSYSPTAKVYTTANLGVNNLSITVKDWTGNAATCIAQVTVQPYGTFGNRSDRSDNPEAISTDVALALFPNPSAGEASLQFLLPEAQPYTLRVFDMTGRMVMVQEGSGLSGENTMLLDLGKAAAGIYLIDLQSEMVHGQKRLMIQRN